MIPDSEQEDGGDFSLVGTDNEPITSRWVPAPGERVEVRRSGCVVRRGVIEAVMRNNSGFWLAADGVEPRVFVLLEDQKQSIRRTVLADVTPP